MRIATGGYEHETNSFSSVPVTYEDMQRLKGYADTYFSNCSGVRNGNGGIIDEAKALGIELVPTVRGSTTPCGPTEKRAFEEVRDELTELLWQAHCQQPLDGIALNLHGGGVAEGYDDLEGEILRSIRARFGPDIPISMRLDLHSNISSDMIELSDIIVGFKSYPHVDDYECGRAAVRLLHNMIQEKTRYHKAFIRLPWLLAPAFGVTLSGAAGDVKAYMEQLVKSEPDLLDATFFHGFTYADVETAGVSVYAIARNEETATRCAQQIADFAWSKRREFLAPINSAETAMELAIKAEYPVVINESSDNTGGGAPGDGTYLLREMLRRNIPSSAFGYIHDPEVVALAVKAGVGSHISCLLGGKTDKLHGEPIAITDAYVKVISDGCFIQKSPMGAGGKVKLGTTVLLVVGNVQIVVSCGKPQTKDDGPFETVGIDWTQMRILALKSTQHFKGWWAGRAKTIIPCDSPGIHSADLASFTYKKLDTNKFPFIDLER